MKHSILVGLVLSILLTFSVTPIYSIICDKPPCLYSSGHFGDIAPAASDLIYEVYSSGGTSMNPPIANTFTLETARTITCIATYHWPGFTPGTIGLQSSSGAVYGPWQAEGRPGMGEKPNCFWVAYFNQVLPPGTYTITDSGQSTWSYDPSDCIASKGICPSKGICQVFAAGLSAPESVPLADLTQSKPALITFPSQTLSKVITPAKGGTVQDEGMSLTAPPGAVSANTEVVVKRLTDEFPPGTLGDPVATVISKVYDFGPDGIKFKEPVQVTISYDPGLLPDGIDENNIMPAYFNGQKWIAFKGSVDRDKKEVSFRTQEFSGSLVVLLAGLVLVAGYAIYAEIPRKWHNIIWEPIIEYTANKYVTPTDAAVVDFASRARLTSEGNSISLTDHAKIASGLEQYKTMRVDFVDSSGNIEKLQFESNTPFMKTPKEYLTTYKRVGDCVDVADALVSILLANGYHAKAVSGYIPGKELKPHAWGEVLIGDKVYIIDENGQLELKESFIERHLVIYPGSTDERCRMWDDKKTEIYDENWYKTYLNAPPSRQKYDSSAPSTLQIGGFGQGIQTGSHQGLARVVKTNGGDPFLNRGNITGRDPLGFLNCLCDLSSIAGASHKYEPNPAGDCVWGNWGVNRGPLPTVSNFTNNSCAISYGITEMRTNKTPIQFVGAGTVLKDGDQLQTTGKTVLMMPDGSELLVNSNSVVSFTSLRTGKVLVKLQQGGARILSPPGGSSNVEIQLGDRLIRPKGTEYTVQWDGKAGSVAVIEGSLNIANETISNGTLSNNNEPEISLEAGQQLETSTGKISPYNLSTDDGGLFVGLPLRELLLNDSDPQPFGTYDGAFADGKIPQGWIWQDPGNDAKIETPENGTLKVTVPDGNELWGGRIDAPRLLHKVTGDFDLEGELLLKSNGTNYAVTQLVLYSPGSNLGILTNQMDTNGLAEDYWVGGGWQKQSGINKLPLLNKDLKDCPNALDSPVKLKITRHEDIVKTYWSQDGRHWNLSTRQELNNISDTVWVGWVFKRMANDGLTSEPAVNTMKGVKLVTAPQGSMEVPEWDVVPGFGEALADNSSIHLALNGSVLGDVATYTGERFAGDLDAVVHFDTSNWTGQDGAYRNLRLFATNGDDKDFAYIDISQSGTDPQRYQTDLGINKGYGRYNWIKTTDLQGYLRIVRHNGNFSTYYWSECQWAPLGEFKTGFTDPVYIGVSIANSYQAKKPVPLAVDFNVEQILAGEAINGNWTPTYCSLIQPVPLPTVITLPQGVEAKMFKPAFALGTIFFGPDGTAYAFSSEKGKQKLMAIDSSGTAHTYAESEILAGINRKTGVMLGSSVLMTVDGWADGGNRYRGIFELDPNGTFSQWNLKSSYGGMGDIISAPDGGWYFSDFESDNIWHLPGRAAAEVPRITVGDSSSRIGLIQLAYDSADGTLYALDNYLDFRNAGTFRVCKITPDGEVVPVANINETSKMNGGMALSSSGPLGHALYVSDAAAGKILKVEGGTTEPVITGLTKPGEMQFNPLNGDLLIVCDDGKSLLWIGNDLNGVGAGRSLELQQGSSQGQPSVMANGSMQSGCRTDPSTGREICVGLSNLGQDQTKDVNLLIKDLKNENSTIRADAAKTLGEIHDIRAVEPLIQALKDNDSHVRSGAAIALGYERDTRAVEPLIQALKDKDSFVRSSAIMALSPSLFSLGEEDINDTRAVEPLIQALKDDNSSVRMFAAMALSGRKDEHAIEPLIQALNDKNMRESAAEALARMIGFRTLDQLNGAFNDTRAVEPFIQALKGDDGDLRTYAVSSLGKSNYARILEPFNQALINNSWFVRVAAAYFLAEINDTRAVEPLIQALKDDNYLVRASAAQSLGKIKDIRAVEPLIPLLKDENGDVRSAAQEALTKLGYNPEKNLPGNIGTHVTIKPGSIWKVKEYGPMGNWDGEWVVREDAQTIDASWSGGGITDIIDIKSMQGDQITLYRHGNKGYYTGTITPDDLSMSGTASWYSPGETWTATRIEGTTSVIPGGYTAYNGPEATSTPTAQLKNFKFKPWGQYDVIEFLGDKYFAAYDPTVTADVANAGESVAFLYDHSRNRTLMGNKQISKVLIDSSNETTITSTSPLELEEGYQLAIKSVDVKGIKTYIELSKNGLVIDSKVVQPSIDNAKMSDQTYYYRTDLGATSGIIQIAVNFKNAFAGPGTNIATVDGVFQISDTVTSLKPQ